MKGNIKSITNNKVEKMALIFRCIYVLKNGCFS